MQYLLSILGRNHSVQYLLSPGLNILLLTWTEPLHQLFPQAHMLLYALFQVPLWEPSDTSIQNYTILHSCLLDLVSPLMTPTRLFFSNEVAESFTGIHPAMSNLEEKIGNQRAVTRLQNSFGSMIICISIPGIYHNSPNAAAYFSLWWQGISFFYSPRTYKAQMQTAQLPLCIYMPLAENFVCY